MDASYINLIGWLVFIGFFVYVVLRFLRAFENWTKH